MSFLEFTEGPLWYVALTVFTVGVAWNIIAILLMRVRGDSAVPRKSAVGGGIKAVFLHMVPHGGFFSRTAYHVIVGYLFHIGLFALLLFGAPHVAFIKEWTGTKKGIRWKIPANPRNGAGLKYLGEDIADYERFTRRIFFGNNDIVRFNTMVVMDRVKVGLQVPLGESE